MSIEATRFRISEPDYYHREYVNDIDEKPVEDTCGSLCQRVTLVALPFLSLYKPLSFPLSLAMGAMRTWTCMNQLIVSIQQGDLKDVCYQFIQTAIAVIALVGTIFAHPLGMLITTSHDLIIEVYHLLQNLHSGDYQKALENCANIVNNALYLALFLRGGLEIAIASLGVQIMLGLYHSMSEFRKGNHLEGFGHLLMGMIRGNQLAGQVKILQMKWKVESFMKHADQEKNQISKTTTMIDSSRNKTNNSVIRSLQSQELIKVTEKYQKYTFPLKYAHFNKFPPGVKACLAGDKEAIMIFLRHGFDLNLVIPGETSYQTILYYGLPLWEDKYGLEKVGKADMFAFLITNGADINKCAGGLQYAIFEFRFDNEKAVDALRLAIQRGAILKGALKYTLNTNWEFWGSSIGHKDRIVELLLESGAKLDY